MSESDDIFYAAEVYGKALFELASEYGINEVIKSDLDELDKFIFSEVDFLEYMTSPFFPIEQKNALIDKLFVGKLDDLTINFLKAAAGHNRFGALFDIMKKFNRLYNKARGHREIWMTVAHAIDRREIESIKTSLCTALKAEQISLQFNVEPAILGGTIIRYEGKMIDNSIRSRLKKAVETIITHGKNTGTSK